ncbi:NAD(P)H-binding protein [Spirillospora sp. NPDC047279]|uniref:NAD(P)H-binding protein n=1 Tax=Spirillospora sp. NPDC047279 TaxID=3155478 RepID=UPI0033D87659
MILVMGATGPGTGNIGRTVVHQLVAAGRPVRALSRDPGRAVRLPDGVEVVKGDLGRPETLHTAFKGVDRMYMMAIDGWGVLEPETAAEVLDVARGAGVRHVVLLSASDNPLVEVEEPLRASGLDWTFLRPGEFAVNTADYWGPSIRDKGEVQDAYLDVRGVPIHEADVAAVAVTALLEDGHVGAIYTMTGPESLSRRDQVRAIGAALGRDISIKDVTPEKVRVMMIDRGWPGEVVDHIFNYFSAWVDNPPEVLSTVEEVTGRPARTYAQWADDHVMDFR